MKPIKEKKCKECTKMFIPYRTTDKVCSRACFNSLSKKKGEEKETRKTSRKKSENKALKEIAVTRFNRHIRERDKGKGCICCAKDLGANYHAGHCFSGGGHAAVLFDENNVHGQRAECNTGNRSGFLADIMQGVENRIGRDEFIILRGKAYEPKKWSNEELRAIIERYRNRKE